MYNSSAEANGSFPEHKVKQMLKDENDSRTTGPKIRLFTEDDYINLRKDNPQDSDDDCDDENQNIADHKVYLKKRKHSGVHKSLPIKFLNHIDVITSKREKRSR